MNTQAHPAKAPVNRGVEALSLAALANLWRSLDKLLPLWFGLAAFQRRLWFTDDADNTQHIPGFGTGLRRKLDDESCYDVQAATWSADHFTHFFLGGPGFNLKCP